MGFKADHFEIVSTVDSGFTEEHIRFVLSDWDCSWAFIFHNKDTYGPDDTIPEGFQIGDKKPDHYHVYIHTGKGSSWNSDNVAKRFGVAGNFVNKVKGRKKDILLYLTHANASGKYPYPESEVVANFDWTKVRDDEIQKANKEARADEIRDNIVAGLWRDYNIHNYVSAKEFKVFDRDIKSAFEYRARVQRGADRNMQAIYIYGDSGTGKSTLAKMMAQEKGMSIYVSSGSNDVLDDYKGEDCIILDDLRPSCMGLSDLLKMLDPNTSSTVKSRYKNKVLECKLIIITTTLPIEKFFNNVFESQNETAVQLMRRCEVKIHLTIDELYMYVWQKKSRRYLSLKPRKNPVSDCYKAQDMTEAEAEAYAEFMLGSIGKGPEQLKLDNI